MRRPYTLFTLCILLSSICFGQGFERLDAPFAEKREALNFALTGGLNAPQFSNVDLNQDGIEDLYIFDRAGNVSLTFISDGDAYHFAPEYALNFPKLNNWALLRDYNADGIMDIFAASSVVGVDGVEVYRGYYENDEIHFAAYPFPADQSFNIIYFPLSSGGRTQLYVSKVDLPSIDDIDCDGDMDILTFNVSGGYAELFTNQAVERGYSADSLIFQLDTNCWGGFYESGITRAIDLSPTEGLCVDNLDVIEPRHAGSTLLTLDLDNDQDRDILISDISFDNVTALYNGGGCDRAWMNAQDIYYPPNGVQAEVALFSASFNADVDNDGVKDLIVAPNDLNNANGNEIVWFYKNKNASNEAPLFELQQKDYLTDNMIELGSGSNPTFVDYNEDGLLDIVVGNLGYALPFGDYDARLTLFENVGTLTAPAFELIDEDYLEFSQFNGQAWDYAPAFGDLDGDGDMDLVVGSIYGTTFYAENIAGAGQVFKFGNIIANWLDINPGQATTPLIMDINEDGLNDIIFGERNGNINYFQNIGTSSEPMFNSDHNASPNVSFVGQVDVRITGYVTGFSAPAIVNVDGDLKLLIGTQNGKIEQYAMDANNMAAEFQLENNDVGTIREGINTRLAVADINNDGFLDALVGNIRGGLSLYTTDFISDSMVSTKTPVARAIKVFPNPTSDYLSVQLEANNDFEVLELVDLNGRVLQTIKVTTPTLQLSLKNRPSGLYFIQLRGRSTSLTKKILVR